MTKLLTRLFIKNSDDTSNPVVREGYGKLAGMTGIILNTLLFGIKLLIGTLAHSIAITADAVNNLTDAGSSVITLIGFKMSGKPADKEHPYGHARIEYISGFIVSIIILLLGLELIRTSVEKILHPEPIVFNLVTILVLAVAIVVKLWLSRFYKGLGKTIRSTTLEATGADSMNDVFATSSVLVATLFAHFTGIQIDGFMGVGVAVFIILAGIRFIRETMNPLLGTAPDADLVKMIANRITSYEGVIGFHDLVVHNYGPERCFASVHVEVCASRDILESHELIDTIEKDFNTEHNIHMVIHMDPIVTNDERTDKLHALVNRLIENIDPELSMHDFRAVFGKKHTNLIFDVVVPPGYKLKDKELTSKINEGIKALSESYFAVITVDRSYLYQTHRLNKT